MLILNADTGVNLIQDGTVTSAKIVDGSVTNDDLQTPYRMVQMTPVTASGTSVDFTGIPAWAKKITVMFSGVSTNGTSNQIVQIGTSLGVEASGYLGSEGYSATFLNHSSGFLYVNGVSATALISGSMELDMISSNKWVERSILSTEATANTFQGSGSKTLSGTLDRIRITTVNGTDTFDAGTINIMVEG